MGAAGRQGQQHDAPQRLRAGPKPPAAAACAGGRALPRPTCGPLHVDALLVMRQRLVAHGLQLHGGGGPARGPGGAGGQGRRRRRRREVQEGALTGRERPANAVGAAAAGKRGTRLGAGCRRRGAAPASAPPGRRRLHGRCPLDPAPEESLGQLVRAHAAPACKLQWLTARRTGRQKLRGRRAPAPSTAPTCRLRAWRARHRGPAASQATAGTRPAPNWGPFGVGGRLGPRMEVPRPRRPGFRGARSRCLPATAEHDRPFWQPAAPPSRGCSPPRRTLSIASACGWLWAWM